MPAKKRKKPAPKTGRVPIESVLRLAKSHRHADKRAIARKTEARRPVSKEDY